MRDDLTDVAGLSVGQAEDEAVRTGVTAVLCDKPAVCAVDVRGGGPGTRETDALRAENLVERADAVVLSGGSVYGLAAADGVCAALGAAGRGFALAETPGVPASPIVPAAILYDLANGGDKAWGAAPPYRDLGQAALADAERGEAVRQGRAGAGFGAMAGRVRGGTGSASARTSDGFTVGALACVNSFGSVLMPGTDVYWAWPFERDGEFGGARPRRDYEISLEDWGAAKADPKPRENTTLCAVATDAALSRVELQRVAIMAQNGLARAIRPAHSPFDGDLVFALSTETHALSADQARPLTVARLGALAADCLTRAIARGVHAAR